MEGKCYMSSLRGPQNFGQDFFGPLIFWTRSFGAPKILKYVFIIAKISGQEFLGAQNFWKGFVWDPKIVEQYFLEPQKY